MGKKFSLETVINLADGITKPLAKAEKDLLKFSGNMKKKWGGLGKDIQSADKMINSVAKGAVIAGGAAVVGAAMIGKSFIDAGAEVEGYKTVLKTMLGSQEAANKRFEEMSKFAASTPFELNEVVQLGNQLQALGQYSEDNMKLLGDLAAASGKPIDQVTSAFAKLVSGQKGEAVNMFRDLLVSTADWSAATGKGIKKTGELMATTEEMIAALPIIMSKKGFAGMMDDLSKTHQGITSNLADTITRFKQGIGGGILKSYDQVLLALTNIIAKFSDAFGARSQKYIDAISSGLERFAKWLSGVDIGKVIDQFFEFIRTVKAVIDFITPLAPLILGLVVAIKLITFAMAAYNVVMWIVSLNPITLFIMGIAAAIAVTILMVKVAIKNFDTFGSALLMIMGPIGLIINAFMIIKKNWDGITTSFTEGGFIEGVKTLGATILQILVKPLAQFLGLLSKIPGVGKLIEPAYEMLDKINNDLFAYSNRFNEGPVTASDRVRGYASPTTRTAESRTYSESRTVHQVELTATPDTSMRPAGGAPARTLNYGAIQ